MAKIGYTDKEDRRTLDSVPIINKVVAADMNEIKESVNALYDIIDTLKTPTVINITSASFSGNNYIDARLVGLTGDTDFNIYTNGGSGTKLKINDGYTFVSGTATITMEPGDYTIILYAKAV